MSDLLRLRDHSQPCPHKTNTRIGVYGAFRDEDLWYCWQGDCPGGREVVLRKREVDDAFSEWVHHTKRDPFADPTVYVEVTDDE